MVMKNSLQMRNEDQPKFVHKVTFDLNDPKYEKAYRDFIDRLYSHGKWVIINGETQNDPPYFEITWKKIDLEEVSGENHAKNA